MKGINLLPEELKPKTYAIKLSKQLRKLAVSSLVLFVIVLMVMAGSYLALRFRNSSLGNSEQKLRDQVKNYETSEQKLVLVGDRLSKIQKILESNSLKSIENTDVIVNNLPEGVLISDIELDSEITNITITTDNSRNLSRFFGVITGLEFKKVALLSFTYSSEVGYQVEVGITN